MLYSWGGFVSLSPINLVPATLDLMQAQAFSSSFKSETIFQPDYFADAAQQEIEEFCVNPDPGTGPTGRQYIPDPIRS